MGRREEREGTHQAAFPDRNDSVHPKGNTSCRRRRHGSPALSMRGWNIFDYIPRNLVTFSTLMTPNKNRCGLNVAGEFAPRLDPAVHALE
jgi:hypothetical protein